MILPCIDLLEGKVVQLVQGRRKALEGDSPAEMLRRFAGFREIQVIDLDAALGQGSNQAIIRWLAERAAIRVGGGVRSPERARQLIEQGARKVIVGTAAFGPSGVNTAFLEAVSRAVGRERLIVAVDSCGGRIVVKGWREATALQAEQALAQLEPYCAGFLCTYVDKEGMLAGTDLEWFRRLRRATGHELTAAGGICTMEEVQELLAMGVNVALGMAIYTGRLDLAALAELDRSG